MVFLIASGGLHVYLRTVSVAQTTQCRMVSEAVQWAAKVV